MLNWHDSRHADNQCALLCLNLTRVPTVYDIADDPVRYVPECELEPLDREELQSCILGKLERAWRSSMGGGGWLDD